jgi:uncharacterized protein (DUF1800 family)
MFNVVDPRWAWERYQPSPKSPWNLQKVGHLYRRAGFGANWEELEAGLRAGPDIVIQSLLSGSPNQASLDEQTRPMAQTIAKANNGAQARAWWLYRMLYSRHPLREKMTLFWHNHFATSNAKVNNAGSMLGQYELLYRHSLGSFGELLDGISNDPAMMVWLDTSSSKKGMPNENYARELMELFSLGIGNFTESDIREAARAFTGWEIKQRKAVFQPGQHDDGEKTVLGQKGKWEGRDIVRICLEQKSAPYFIVGKLFRYLVSESAPAGHDLLDPLASRFRKSGYNIGQLVETILRSNLFYSAEVYRTRVKGPVDFAVGIVHGLEGRIGTTALAQSLEELGQNLFYPPSVKGWDGGPAWLNGQTLLSRQNLALAFTSTEDNRFGRRTDPAALVKKYNLKSDQEVVDFFLKLFLEGDVAPESRSKLLQYMIDSVKHSHPVYWTRDDAADHRVRSLCHLVLTLPEFQLG